MNPFEPERYELVAGPAYDFPLDRRGFFKTLGGGVVVSVFGASAPLKELTKKFGFTPEHVVSAAKAQLPE